MLNFFQADTFVNKCFTVLFLVYYVFSVFLIAIRIPREERMMLEKFGEEYRVYMKRTGRLLPRFRQENSEEK
jgi:protein-S-isoprenylcysteine O-methyltransferase Ste14